ncbi:hypothetical protein ANO11243_038300 [Dothideomycetidae sp. 11243]|nr:hypothetical protein ANO11243_038300 [fungal sp. No.11243]
MPKVQNHTPAWLSRPSTGFSVFQPADKTKTTTTLSGPYGKKIDHRGALRTLAHRGTEIFFVVENEIRWSDLVLLKEAGDGSEEFKQSFTSKGAEGSRNISDDAKEAALKSSRVLKTPVAGQIRQLVISPLGDFMAIITSHTVHIAVLPRKFETSSSESIRPKTFQLGPTAHVLEQAPLASVLWHPLGALGACLVTVATDACVRLWELDTKSRHSFSEPALALDLKKLANAASYGEDMRASVYGTSKGFSPDQVEMEVAAACFGGIGSPDELGWASMTLWVAMTEGDTYALCPLLPSKWQPSVSTIPSLSTSVIPKVAILEQDLDASEAERRQAIQQKKWLQDIDSQEPLMEVLPGGLETVEIYQRPAHPPAIPKLQGPFHLSPEPEYAEITDILAIGPRLEEDLFSDEEEDDYGVQLTKSGLSVGLVCLLTKSATVHVCLDVNGVEAMWLPARKSHWEAPSLVNESTMLVIENLDLGSSAPQSWPTFTMNVSDRSYSFLVTLSTGTHLCNLSPWISNLESELSDPGDTGSSFRIGLMYESEKTAVDHLIKVPSGSSPATAAISIIDSDLGHFVLSTSSNQPYSATLDLPVSASMLASYAPDSAPLLLPAPENREAYRPAEEFFNKSSLASFIDSTLQAGNTRLKRSDLKSQVRLSPATLQLLTESHRILSDETNRLGLAAADLFRRCQRMQAELAEQIRKVREIKDLADSVTGEGDDQSARDKVKTRLESIGKRDAKLQERFDGLRRKMAGQMSGKELSKREEAWSMEAKEIEAGLDGALGDRIAAVKKLKEQLLTRVRAVEGLEEESKSDATSGTKGAVPSDIRKRKLKQVMLLLERETALVDAVSDRLGRLSGLGGV